ncbi:MAG: DUF4430 domain-containing protein [Candidatus Zixiibacteriota bacterium]|nr:MAG: DUF4430 domain-containing protein [candidate division Zixibacteria bacterium]
MVRYRRLFLVLTLVLSSVFLSCGSGTDDLAEADDPGRDSAATVAFHDSLIIEMTGRDSLSVLDILMAEHQVDYFSTAAGVFVTAIDSIGGASRLFWVYSVNDTMAQVASDRYITRSGDRIKWHLRRLEP